MKKALFPLALAAVALTTACNDDEVQDIIKPDSEKEMITFSTSAETGAASSSSMTRAGFTGGTEYDGTKKESTQIVARFSSSNGTDSRHTKTILSAKYDSNANKGANMASCSEVEYATGHERFWDDAFGRDAKLSIYAVAVPNYTDVINNGSKLYDLVQKGSANVSAANANWQTDTENATLNSIVWQVSTTQTNGFDGSIAREDLCYSHNIQLSTDDGSLNYGKGKDGVRVWGKYDNSDRDANGYPVYKWDGSSTTDHYPTLDNGQMQFRLTNASGSADGPGHFDKGHMIFHHAMTRITVKLFAEEGCFNTDGSDFVLSSDYTTLLNMHYKGTFNFKEGTWSAYTEGTGSDNSNIKMASIDASSSIADYINFAQVVPGYVLDKNSNVNVMKFTISDNVYYITQKQLFAALDTDNNKNGVDINGNPLVTVTSDKITLEQGKNYIFNITVKKTGIQTITATLVDWVNVEGNAEAKNDYVKISLLDKTNIACEHFDLYRMSDDQTDIYAPTTGPGTGTDWTEKYNWYGNLSTEESKNYKDKATLSATSTTGVWKADNWFWESNKSFYHFRTVNTGLAIQKNTTTEADYFNVYGGAIQDYDASHSTISIEQNSTSGVNDYHWGAPFKPGSNLTYDPTYGWSAAQDKDGQIYPAIGSTSQTINMIEHHMMSNIHIILKTVKDETNTTGNKLGAGAVNLENSVVTITNFANEGTVEMGRGLVTPSSTILATQVIPVPSSYYKTSGDNSESNAYGYRVVPQALYRTTTPDSETDLSKFIGLTIKTPDNNQYYIIKNLSDITAKTITNQGSKTELTVNGKILRWYPGYDYTYTITISKKGIEAITCSIVDWVTVTGENINIDLES